MAESRRPSFTVDWKIEKGMIIHPTLFCHNHNFFVADLQNTAWRLIISLETDHLCVLIGRRSKGDAGPGNVDIECDFELLFIQQESDVPHSLREDSIVKMRKTSFLRGQWSEKVEVASRGAIDGLKDEDMLLLRCRVWPRDSSSFLHTVRHFVRTEAGCPEFFTWTVEDFSALQRGDTRNYELQKTNQETLLMLDLYLGKDSDTIQVHDILDEEYYFIRSIWVIDANGGKTLCLENCWPFDSYDYGTDIPLRIRKSKLLEEKEKFLPNDQLTLYFDLRFNAEIGVLDKVIIGDSMVDDNSAPNTRDINRRDVTVQPTFTSISPTEDLPLPSSNTANHHSCPLTDFELRIGSEVVRVHKAILAARSPLLLDMLTNDLRESSQQGVDIEDLEMDTAQQLVDFMYLDSVPNLDFNSAIKLYSAANKYRVVDLMKKCSEILKSKLCVQNVCPILSVADTHADDDLKQFVLEFISQNEGRIIPSHEWENFLNENMPLASRVMLFLYKKRIET